MDELARIYLGLGPNARRVLLALAQRLDIGKAHGDFDKPLDLDAETLAEELDGAVYRAAKLMGLCRAPELANPHPEDGSDASVRWPSSPDDDRCVCECGCARCTPPPPAVPPTVPLAKCTAGCGRPCSLYRVDGRCDFCNGSWRGNP